MSVVYFMYRSLNDVAISSTFVPTPFHNISRKRFWFHEATSAHYESEITRRDVCSATALTTRKVGSERVESTGFKFPAPIQIRREHRDSRDCRRQKHDTHNFRARSDCLLGFMKVVYWSAPAPFWTASFVGALMPAFCVIERL